MLKIKSCKFSVYVKNKKPILYNKCITYINNHIIWAYTRKFDAMTKVLHFYTWNQL